jgi:glycosyltransferase involved in cell wall biosynthesis
VEIKPRETDWADVSATYGVHVEPHELALGADLERILAEAGVGPGATLLEAGSGSGHLSLMLRKAGYRTDLLDFDAVALEKAAESLKAEFADAAGESKLILGDLLKLDAAVDADSYDVVWNSGVLEHFTGPTLSQSLEQMARAAKRAVIVLVPNPKSVIYLAYREEMLRRQRWNVGVEFLREDYPHWAEAAGLTLGARGYCGAAYTRVFLGAAFTSEADRARLAKLVDTGVCPAETFYLQYFVFIKAASPSSTPLPKPKDQDLMIDKTFYLDALGAANAATARLALTLERAEADRDRAQQELQRREGDDQSTREDLARVQAELAEARTQCASLQAALEEARRAGESTVASLPGQISELLRSELKPLREAATTRFTGEGVAVENLAQLSQAQTELARAHAAFSEAQSAHTTRLEQARAELAATLSAANVERRELRQRLDALTTLGLDSLKDRRELAAARAELERVKREAGEAHAQLGHAQADRDRLRAEVAALEPRLLRARELSGLAIETLESFKNNKGFRVAHYLNVVGKRFLAAPGASRKDFINRVKNRASGDTGVFADWHALKIPQDQIRHGLGAIDEAISAVRPTAASDRTAPDGGVVIPPAVAVRVPAPAKRRPHGQRRVAYLTNMLLDWNDQRLRFGGGERYAWTLAQLMRDLGLSVHFFQGSLRPFEGNYYGFPVTGVVHHDWFSEFNHGMTRKFAELAADYDHVIYNLPEYTGGPVREDGVMICHGIWYDHNNYYPASKFRTAEWYRLLGRAFAGPQRIVSVDTNSINVTRTIWPELGAKMTYIPNFYNSQDFYPEPGRRESDPLMILFPRRSQRNRGSRILAEILSRVPHDVRFCWVGEGDREDMDMIIDLSRRDPRLSFHRADFHEMPQWYRHADISVIPTIACEGTSLSLLESLACGVPTVSTNVGGLPDLLHYGNNGLLVDPTPEALAEAINHLIENPAERARLRRTSIESIRPFELGRWRGAWANVLKQLDWVPADAVAHLAKDAEIRDTSRQARLPAVRRPGVELEQSAEPRVAILTRNATHGGVESIVASQAKLLGASVIVCGGLDNKKTCPFTYTRADSYDDLLAALQAYDIVIYHWLLDWGVHAVRDSGLPCVEFVHRSDTCDNDKSVPTAIATHSTYLADEIRARFGRDCAFVSHPIDVKNYVAPEKLGTCIGAVTSYSSVKGIDLFIEAWAQIASEYPGVKARFYGSGPDQAALEAQAARLGVDVEFRGPVTSPAEYYREFRVLVCPSRIEGFPMVIAEAAAMNIPIVASDLAGIVEFNRTAEFNGFKRPVREFEQESVKDLVRALREELDSDQRPEGRDYIEKYLHPSIHLRRMRDILAGSLIRGRHRERSFRTESAWADDTLRSPDGRFVVQHIHATADDGAVLHTPETVQEHRNESFDNRRFPQYIFGVSPVVDSVSVRVSSETDGQLSWQVVWLDKAGYSLGHSSGPLLLSARQIRTFRCEAFPTGTVSGRLTLRPYDEGKVVLRRVEVWTSINNDKATESPEVVVKSGLLVGA